MLYLIRKVEYPDTSSLIYSIYSENLKYLYTSLSNSKVTNLSKNLDSILLLFRCSRTIRICVLGNIITRSYDQREPHSSGFIIAISQDKKSCSFFARNNYFMDFIAGCLIVKCTLNEGNNSCFIWERSLYD